MTLVIVIALALVTTRGADADDLTHEYVVNPGDTCVSIAVRQLGDAARCTEIHRLNPFLGKSPDNLKPGAVLSLPTAARPPSDSRLTAARGSVQVLKPASLEWDRTQLGMDLFRAWRVRAENRSSAEVAFRDTARLFIRENTRVIIYGASGSRATLNANAELESGALESRLVTRSGRRVVIHTPFAEASLGNGSALVVVDPATGTDTIVANHGGAPVTVRALDASRKPRGAAIRVAAGMGCKVKSGRPSSPRALPPAPVWQSSADRFVDLAGGGAVVSAQWSPVAAAASYRVAVRTADGKDVLATEVDARASAVDLHRLHPGRYVATVATIDADRFESLPSSAFAFDVVPIAIIPPGSIVPLVVAPLNEWPPGPESTTPPATVARGSRVVAGGGFTCADGADFSSELTLMKPIRELTCRDPDGRLLPPVSLSVAFIDLSLSDGDSRPLALHQPISLRLRIRSQGPLGPELLFRGTELDILATTTRAADVVDLLVRPTDGLPRISVVTADGIEIAAIFLAVASPYHLSFLTDVPVFPPRRYPGLLEIGLFGGYWIVPGQPALGAPVDAAHAVSDGPATGVRAALWLDEGVGVDLEAMVAFTGQAEGPATARVPAWRGHLFVGTRRRRLGVRVLVGGGTNTLDSRSPGTSDDTRGVLEVGAAATLRVADAWLLRLDVRDDFLLTRSNEATHIPALYLGVSRAFLR